MGLVGPLFKKFRYITERVIVFSDEIEIERVEARLAIVKQGARIIIVSGKKTVTCAYFS